MPGHWGGGYHGHYGMHGHYYGHGRYGHPWSRHRFWGGGPGSMFPDPQVSTAQACLAQVVDPSVPQNGIMGPQTRQAIRTFQMQQQMPPTGMLDNDTMSALQAACSPQQAAPPPPPPPPPPPQVQVSPPPPGSRHSQGQGQQEAFLGDILNPLGPLGGVIGGLFQGGGSQPQPPPPPDDGGDPSHWRRRRRFGRWHHETENEFPFERPFFDFHRPDRFPEGRWRGDHDRRDWWDRDREGEVRAEPVIQADHARPVAQPGFARPVAAGGVARPVVDRPVVERPVIERPIIERPVIERPVFARPAFARPGFDFHVHDRFPFARDRWNWNRDRFRWFGRPWGRRDWGFGFSGGGPQVAWVQSCLAQVLGSWVVQDGIMGPATQGAIRTFQEQQQMPVTGVLDGPTVNALQAACGSQMP